MKDFFSVYKDINIDILQLRPITKQGDTAYSNFEYGEIINKYDDVLLKVKTEAIERNIICIAPLKTQLIKSEGDSFDSDITNSTYCYISPNYAWRKDFDLNNDTFESYSKRVGTSSQLFKNIFKKKVIFDGKKKQLNYTID